MKSLALKFTVSLMLLGIVQAVAWAAPIREEEVKQQKENFQQWWNAELVWRFDDLPAKGSVPQGRMPYAGAEYPDRAGGTTNVLRKYDQAFNRGRSLAASHEQWDIKVHSTQGGGSGRGLFGLARLGRPAPPHWSGHCNGWVTAAIRHAEPENNVVRNGVVFTPADIKGLFAELYMYTDTVFLGGVDAAINPALMHVVIANWVGRGKHPIGMETSVGEEVWNYPIYAYSSAFAKHGDREVEVKVNVGYVKSLGREYNKAPENFRYKYFHYTLDLNEKGEITGGSYYRDSDRIDMLWAPLKASAPGSEGNGQGNPHLKAEEVLAMWRESVPEEKRKNWWNIDPVAEDAVQESEIQPEGVVAGNDSEAPPEPAEEAAAAPAATTETETETSAAAETPATTEAPAASDAPTAEAAPAAAETEAASETEATVETEAETTVEAEAAAEVVESETAESVETESTDVSNLFDLFE